jgi:hypothetical protein
MHAELKSNYGGPRGGAGWNQLLTWLLPLLHHNEAGWHNLKCITTVKTHVIHWHKARSHIAMFNVVSKHCNKLETTGKMLKQNVIYSHCLLR